MYILELLEDELSVIDKYPSYNHYSIDTININELIEIEQKDSYKTMEFD